MGYKLKINENEILFKNEIECFIYLNKIKTYKYKLIRIIGDKEVEINIQELYKDKNTDDLIEYYLNNNEFLLINSYFMLLDICLLNLNSSYKKLFNKLLTLNVFKEVFLNIDKNILLTNKLNTKILNEDEIKNLYSLIKEDKIDYLNINKLYQFFITILLDKEIEILDKNYLIKNYTFNAVFLNKNAKYFDSIFLAIWQRNKSKEFESLFDIIKNELLALLNLKDIDINILNNYLKYIYSNYMDVPTDISSFNIYYYCTNNESKSNWILNKINNGILNTKYLKSSIVNKYINENFQVQKNKNITNVNIKSEIIPLYGLYGVYDIQKVYSKKIIVKKDGLQTQTIFTIIKPTKKGDLVINNIIFVILDTN